MNKYKVFIVDDDPDIGSMIRMMLEYKGFQVELTDKGALAEEMIKSLAPDLIIMDMFLSGVNGTDICRQLKNDETSKRIPVVMISAHPNAREICLGAGADAFIAKPFDMDDILQQINELLFARMNNPGNK